MEIHFWVNCPFNCIISCLTLKNAELLFQPMFGSNMDKPNRWVKNVIKNSYQMQLKSLLVTHTTDMNLLIYAARFPLNN